jgi:alcohol dehydrogenase class IV
MTRSAPFRFDYRPAALRYGTGATAHLADELARHGVGRALVVCGQTVGETAAVIEPVIEGLGERLAGVFAQSTPQKRLQTAYDGLEAMRAHKADALVGLGGGSSLDVAKMIRVLAAESRGPNEVARELAATGSIKVPAGELPPLFAVPTTLAGADLSSVAGVTASPASGLVERTASGGIADARLMPSAVIADPALFATTPRAILAASAMNGFNKGVETLYARKATPVTDATAMRGLRLLRPALERLGACPADEVSAQILEECVQGLLLVQYGISRPDGSTLSIIHAFGHGLTRTYPVQQGAAHAIIAPAVLEYLFGRVDARRDLLAEALGVDGDDPAQAVVAAVAGVGEALGLPSQLRAVDGPKPDAFDDVAEAILADSFMKNAPPGLVPSRDEILGVLEKMY